jgi:hypothetical protein
MLNEVFSLLDVLQLLLPGLSDLVISFQNLLVTCISLAPGMCMARACESQRVPLPLVIGLTT